MASPLPPSVQAHLDQRRTQYLEELTEFLSIPSISALSSHREDVHRAARWLQARWQQAGLSASLDPTPGNPIVRVTSRLAAGRPTVLLYGHYDVQPVDPESAWQTPPFTPEIRNDAIFARGASDDKGQIFLQCLAVECWLESTQTLPVNILGIFEGEEEIGSPNLPGYLRTMQEMLAADVAVVCDTPMFGPDLPSICYGLRGLAALNLTVHGPFQDLHSGVYGGAVANPAHGLAELIASLHHPDGRVAVEGFYDGVEPLEAPERDMLAHLPFDTPAWRKSLGILEEFGERGFSILERVWARPTLEVNGMWSGFLGEGRKTIIPADAHAKITCRLVPNQQPARVLEALQAHLRAHCPPGLRLTIEVGEGDPGIVLPREHPAIQAAEQAIASVYHKPANFIRMGGSIPVVQSFQELLGIPTLLLGFALPTENFHAPNEHFHLENLFRGAATLATFWSTFAHG